MVEAQAISVAVSISVVDRVLVLEIPAKLTGTISMVALERVSVVDLHSNVVTSITRISASDLVVVLLYAANVATDWTIVSERVSVVEIPSKLNGVSKLTSERVLVRDLHLIGATSRIRMSDCDLVLVLLLASNVVGYTSISVVLRVSVVDAAFSVVVLSNSACDPVLVLDLPCNEVSEVTCVVDRVSVLDTSAISIVVSIVVSDRVLVLEIPSIRVSTLTCVVDRVSVLDTPLRLTGTTSKVASERVVVRERHLTGAASMILMSAFDLVPVLLLASIVVGATSILVVLRVLVVDVASRVVSDSNSVSERVSVVDLPCSSVTVCNDVSERVSVSDNPTISVLVSSSAVDLVAVLDLPCNDVSDSILV